MKYVYNSLEEMFDDVSKDVENKHHQREIYKYLFKLNEFKVGTRKLTEVYMLGAFKIDVLRNLPRYSTNEIKNTYGIEFEDAIWLKLYENDTQVYYAVVNHEGIYKRARIEKNKNILISDVAKNYGTTNQEYKTKRLHYSRYTFDRDIDLGISEHVLVCVANGLFDDLTIDEIAVATVNHKNRDHYDNRPSNLELTDMKGQVEHKMVSDTLIENGVFSSIDVKHCKLFNNLSNLQKDKYIKLLKSSEYNENYNNLILDSLIV